MSRPRRRRHDGDSPSASCRAPRADAALPRPLGLADAAPADAPSHASDGLPPGYDGYAPRSSRPDFPGSLLPDGTGYAFALSESLFDPSADLRRVNLEAYFLTD